MADSYTPHLNLRKPEVGAAHDTWGGLAGLNGDLDLIDAVFLATGLGTSVGLHVGTGKTLNVEGSMQIADSTDPTKRVVLLSSEVATATIRTLKFPDEDGTLVTTTAIQRLVPTGTVLSGYYGTPPDGFVLLDGRTIGSVISGATNRANSDCEALFLHLWVFGFAVVGGRGASAAADWAADRQLTLPNHSGRVMAGRDNLSGTAAGILPGYTAVGVAGGAQSHTLSVHEMPSHNHSASVSGGALVSFVSPSVNFASPGPIDLHDPVVTIGNAGGNGAHNNIQPTIAVDVIIAL